MYRYKQYLIPFYICKMKRYISYSIAWSIIYHCLRFLCRKDLTLAIIGHPSDIVPWYLWSRKSSNCIIVTLFISHLQKTEEKIRGRLNVKILCPSIEGFLELCTISHVWKNILNIFCFYFSTMNIWFLNNGMIRQFSMQTM